MPRTGSAESYAAIDIYEVTSRVAREAAKVPNFYGTPMAVLANLEPWLELGVSDVLFCNTAGMGGSRYAASCREADLAVQAALAGRPVRRPA